jgi:hypothetical protein
MWWYAGDRKFEDAITNVGRKIDFTSPIRRDVRLNETLPQRPDVVAIVSTWQNLATGRASGHLVVVFAIARHVHGEFEGFEAVVLR